jgi:hypothetical protein
MSESIIDANFKFVLVFIGLGIAIAILSIWIVHKKRGNGCSDVKVQNSMEQIGAGKVEWFNEVIRMFEKKYCGYLIESERIEKGLSISAVKPLQEKYGVVLVKPSLSLVTVFCKKYPDDKISVLYELERKWLENQGIRNIDEDSLSSETESKAIHNATAEFNKVFVTHLEN